MCQLMSGLWVSPGHSPSDPLGLAGTKSTSCGLAALQGPQWLSPRPAGSPAAWAQPHGHLGCVCTCALLIRPLPGPWAPVREGRDTEPRRGRTVCSLETFSLCIRQPRVTGAA